MNEEEKIKLRCWCVGQVLKRWPMMRVKDACKSAQVIYNYIEDGTIECDDANQEK